MTRELAEVLGRDTDDMPRIRKTDDAPAKYSVLEMIMLVKDCTLATAFEEFDRLREHYGDGLANCQPIRFLDSIGRLSRNETPVATLEGLVEIVLLLTGFYCSLELFGRSHQLCCRRGGSYRDPTNPLQNRRLPLSSPREHQKPAPKQRRFAERSTRSSSNTWAAAPPWPRRSCRTAAYRNCSPMRTPTTLRAPLGRQSRRPMRQGRVRVRSCASPTQSCRTSWSSWCPCASPNSKGLCGADPVGAPGFGGEGGGGPGSLAARHRPAPGCDAQGVESVHRAAGRQHQHVGATRARP